MKITCNWQTTDWLIDWLIRQKILMGCGIDSPSFLSTKKTFSMKTFLIKDVSQQPYKAIFSGKKVA
jgi:hypothetical protein